MAALTFADLQTEVFDQTGLDSTDTNNHTRVQRWLNYVQQDIFARWPCNFLSSSETVVTVPDYTTGTVSINNGSATVSGSGTTFISAQGNGQYYIQFSGANDWYLVTTFNSATSLTITPTYTPTANLVNGTYTPQKVFLQSFGVL